MRGSLRTLCNAVASPTIPPPTMTTSNCESKSAPPLLLNSSARKGFAAQFSGCRDDAIDLLHGFFDVFTVVARFGRSQLRNGSAQVIRQKRKQRSVSIQVHRQKPTGRLVLPLHFTEQPSHEDNHRQ